MSSPILMTFLITDLHRGGSPLMLAALAGGLKARGRLLPRVVSIAPLGEIAGVLQAQQVPVVSLNARGNRDWRVLPRLARELHAHPPAILCAILVHANLLATLVRPFAPPLRLVQCIHTVQERPHWHWVLQGMLTPFADRFIAPSQSVIDKLAKFGPIPRAAAIPNGIDIARFQNAAPVPAAQRPWLATRAGGAAAPRIIGYLGRFDPVKRLPLLLDAFAIVAGQFQDVHLALVGYGPQHPALERQARDLGLHDRIHFPGPTSAPESWLKTFDVFCSPSAAEGFGLTIVEALAAGTPVVACRVPGVAANEANGGDARWQKSSSAHWLEANPSASEIAQNIVEALFTSGEKKSVNIMDGIDGPSRYSQEAMVVAYERQFQTLIESSIKI